MPNEIQNQPEDSPQNPNPAGQNKSQVARFVSKIKNLDLQIGEHVLAALQHQDTVAVLTTIVIGPGGEQHIVSASLTPQRMAQVNELLEEAQQERVEEEVCYGFHCLINPKPRK